MSRGTFTITNIGSQGALFDTPILVPPRAAMLGTGAIVKRPRVVIDSNGNESIGVRSVCYLPLTYDHRLIDGADAGRFLLRSNGDSKKGHSKPTWSFDHRAQRRHRDRGLFRSDRLGAGVVLCATDHRVIRIVRPQESCGSSTKKDQAQHEAAPTHAQARWELLSGHDRPR